LLKRATLKDSKIDRSNRMIRSFWLSILLAVIFSNTLGALNEPVFVRERIVNEAFAFLDTPYIYGGADSRGVDCSGLVFTVFKEAADKILPRRVADLYYQGEEIEDVLLPGDLLFFDTTGGPSHVGIYIGEQRFIHSASAGTKTGVIISSLAETYYSERMLGARRLVHLNFPKITLLLNGREQEKRDALLLTPGLPVNFILAKGSGLISFKAYKDDQEYFSRLVRLENEDDLSILWFTPSAGRWTIRAEDQRGMILAVFNFKAARKG